MNLSKYKNEVSSKKIYLEVETIYQKNVLTRDASGEINKYELVAKVTVRVNSNNQKLKFKEKYQNINILVRKKMIHKLNIMENIHLLNLTCSKFFVRFL